MAQGWTASDYFLDSALFFQARCYIQQIFAYEVVGLAESNDGGDFKESEFNSLAADGWSLPIMSVVATACWMNPHADWWGLHLVRNPLSL